MIKVVLISILTIFIPHKLLTDIKWYDTKNISTCNISIRSIFYISWPTVQKIDYLYNLSRQAISEYERIDAKLICPLEPLEIRLVTSYILNNPKYFVRTQDNGTYKGRYFSTTNTLYLSEPFDNKTLVHEFYHFFVDSCNLNILNEEEKALDFEEFVINFFI